MKNKNRYSLLLAVVLMGTLSSCNRGYGCPTNFSIDVDTIIDTVTNLASVWIF